MRCHGISNRLSNLRGSVIHSLASALLFFGMLVSTSAMAQVENIQNGYAGADAGDWGGKKGAVIGPADDTCANMGAVGKVNLVSNFGFSIPLAATITELRAFTKAGAGSPQNVGVQLATDAVTEPPTVIGNEVLFPFPDVGGGSCASTIVSDIGNGLGFWGLGSLTPVDVNNSTFGMVFTKKETSEIKVDSICMQIHYETDDGPAVVEECFAVVLPSNTITVVKDVVGAPPAGEWAYSGTLGAFTLPAGGGFETFMDLDDGTYTITETPKPGWTVTSECLIGGEVVSSGAASVSVDVADDVVATCIFTNTLNTGSFTVVKDFSDDNAAVVDMTLTCTSGTVTVNPLGASEGSPAVFEVTGFVPGATCTATEAATPGYTQVTADCEDNDLIDGSCTMTNNLNVGAFTVIKDFSDDNAAVVDMTLACTSGTVTANPLGASEGSPAVFEVTGFLPGATCTATEAATPGYTQVTADCENGDPIGGSCTMTNNLNVGAFTVIKDFSDDNAASVDMTLLCTSGSVTTNPVAAAEGSPAIFEVTGYVPGATCTATEAATPGYTQVTTDCENGDPIGGSCTMTNNLNVGGFTVIKDFSDDDAASVDMTLLCTSGSVTTNPVAAAEGSPAIFEVTGYDPGATCTATEAATPGYTQVTADCENGDPIGGSCTMTNNLNVGAFTVLKDFSDDDAASVEMTLLCTSGSVTTNPVAAAEGSPAIFEVTGYDPGATCTATEADTPGYDQDNSACQAGDLSAVDGSCTMVNTLRVGAFTVLKDFSDDSDASVDMTLTCTSGSVTTNPVAAAEGSPAIFEVTGFDLDATCTAAEADTPGYDQDASACEADDLLADGGSCTMVNTLRMGEFTVMKDFSDDSDASVDMTLSCTSGSVTTNPVAAAEGSPAIFETTGFDLDATCTATEADTPGYDQDISDCQADDLSAVDGSCTMVNSIVPKAVFRVTKDFTDDNPMEVKVNIDCNGGDPLQSDSMIADAPGPDGFVDFVVNYYTAGELTCEIWESPVPGGYNDTYEASELIEGSAASLSGGEDRCQFVEVQGGNFFCHITNTPNMGKLEVTKEWVVEGAAGNKLYFGASIAVRSAGEIDGGQVCDSGWCTWLNYEGPATDTQTVLIYTDYLGRHVGLRESIVDSDFEVDNNCGGGTTGSVRVYPEGFDGQPDIARCTFTNTVYFEGIPTLNQYGMAILALLMLGVGFIGFRRFV